MSGKTPDRDTFLVFGRPLLGDAEIEEVTDSLRSGWIGTGPKVQRFERMLEEYVGVSHVRCVSSCTAALMLGTAGTRRRPRRRGDRPRDDVHRLRQCRRARRGDADPRRQRARDGVDRPRSGGGRNHAADGGDHAGPFRRSTGRHGPAQRTPRSARDSRCRGRRARHRRRVARTANRDTRQPHGLLVLRDEEHHDGRRRCTGDGGRGGRGTRRTTRAARSEPRRLAAVLRQGLQALRGRSSPGSSST